ncbi:uncharacterized protein VTP21DRAFT_1138 [Calcarisporiella thermophila]|uniref:uncharacterized protein n=1 Tax=Calcarisporiella thermophila TaxID=911321 RepID=UPI003742A120
MAFNKRSLFLLLGVLVFAQCITLSSRSAFFVKRSVYDALKENCRALHQSPDTCAYVRDNCRGFTDGLINYLELYYCRFNNLEPLGYLLLLFWLFFLFGFVGIAASDFFCPNLATISSNLNLSESVAGVTLLAIGNGSPDLFSTFSAMKSNSGSLAIGELVGAAAFIASVVTSSMALVTSFTVNKASFIRDLLFFSGALLIIVLIVYDQKLYFHECAFLVGYYITYVITVVFGGYIWDRVVRFRDRLALILNLRSAEEPQPETEPLGENEEPRPVPPILRIQTSDLFDSNGNPTFANNDAACRPSADSRHSQGTTFSFRNLPYTASAAQNSMDDLIPSPLRRQNTTSSDQGSVHYPITPRPGIRPSFFCAIEFRDMVNNLHKQQPLRPTDLERSQSSIETGSHHSRSPRSPLSHLTAGLPGNHSSSSRPGELARSQSSIDSSSVTSRSPRSPHSPRSYLAVTTFQNYQPPSDGIPHERRPSNEHTALLVSTQVQDGARDSSKELSPAEASIGDLTHQVYDERDSQGEKKGWNRWRAFLMELYLELFPSLFGWRQKSLFAKLISIIACPIYLALTLTLPVVEVPTIPDEPTEWLDPPADRNNTLPDVPGHPPMAAEPPQGPAEPAEEKGTVRWCRWLYSLQLLCSPVFVASVLSAVGGFNPKIIPISAGVGIALSALLMATTSSSKPPSHLHLICYLGFVTGICWIYIIANEVVAVLQSTGIILGLSEAILGLTIFAMGNSLGDFVANTTLARMGFPTMAFTACYGSPLLNTLLGIGLGGSYMTWPGGGMEYYSLLLSRSILVTALGLMLVLILTLIIVPLNGYNVTKLWAVLSLSIYFTCMAINVVLEILGQNAK